MTITDHPLLAAALAIGGLAALAAIVHIVRWLREAQADLNALEGREPCSDFGSGEPPAIVSPPPGHWPTFDGRR